MKHVKKWGISVLLGLSVIQTASACTRALYAGTDNTVIVGRSMDWDEDMQSAIWVFPRGITRNGQAGPNSPMWQSKYGSVATSIYGLATADGMNEKGLVMNLLYLAESDYGQPQADHPDLSVALWGQYALDNFATVNEAVAALEAKPFHIVAPNLPNGVKSTAHLSLSDQTGDSAIFEYIGGKLVVHHGKAFNVMTNSPIYSEQLALNTYWQSIGGTAFLPGTSRAADRFARTSFYINAIPKQLSKAYIQSVPGHTYANQAVASVLSVIRAVSVPLGLTTPNEPNIASTIFRTVSDEKNLVYYYDSSTTPNTFWIDMHNVHFDKDKPVLKLDLTQGQVYSGEVSRAFKPSSPLTFMSASSAK